MGNLGWTEILIILGIALIIFGPRKLPQLGKSLGESLAQFRRASEDFKRTWEREVEEEKGSFDFNKRLPPYLQTPSAYATADGVESPVEPESNPTSEESVSTSEETVTAQAEEVEPAVAETK